MNPISSNLSSPRSLGTICGIPVYSGSGPSDGISVDTSQPPSEWKPALLGEVIRRHLMQDPFNLDYATAHSLAVKHEIGYQKELAGDGVVKEASDEPVDSTVSPAEVASPSPVPVEAQPVDIDDMHDALKDAWDKKTDVTNQFKDALKEAWASKPESVDDTHDLGTMDMKAAMAKAWDDAPPTPAPELQDALAEAYEVETTQPWLQMPEDEEDAGVEEYALKPMEPGSIDFGKTAGNTAIPRTKPSTAVSEAHAQGLINGRVLHQGAGLLNNPDRSLLDSVGPTVHYDLNHSPETAEHLHKSDFDTVVTPFVVNTLPSHIRHEGYDTAAKSVKPEGSVVIAARHARNVRPSASWIPHEDGFLVPNKGKWNFQRGYTPQQLAEEASQHFHDVRVVPAREAMVVARKPKIHGEPAQQEQKYTEEDSMPSAYSMTASEIDEAVKSWEPPTDGQATAGNYKKPRVSIHGISIAIENPKGSKRRPEWPTLKAHYGYASRVLGETAPEARDGDKVDIFIGDNPSSESVFVVDQERPDSKRYDEPKCILGVDTEEDARKLYLSNYTPGWHCGPITHLTVEQFKNWLQSGDTTKRIADQVSKFQQDGEPEQYAALPGLGHGVSTERRDAHGHFTKEGVLLPHSTVACDFDGILKDPKKAADDLNQWKTAGFNVTVVIKQGQGDRQLQIESYLKERGIPFDKVTEQQLGVPVDAHVYLASNIQPPNASPQPAPQGYTLEESSWSDLEQYAQQVKAMVAPTVPSKPPILTRPEIEHLENRGISGAQRWQDINNAMHKLGIKILSPEGNEFLNKHYPTRPGPMQHAMSVGDAMAVEMYSQGLWSQAQLDRYTQEKLVGGKADGVPDSEFDADALAEGVKHEMEHTDDEQVAKEIAKDHLKESKTYYSDLKKMESTQPKDGSDDN